MTPRSFVKCDTAWVQRASDPCSVNLASAPAKATTGLEQLDDQLSWHSLRHTFASILATDLDLPVTTLAELVGHSDAAFTLRVYARDGRDRAVVVEDVLARAAGAGIGG